jgi:two-component system response regulator PilR (NtrC family)
MESEFFGHRKGAFTGADSDREGFFQAASGGTLFLDEVADLPLAMQVKLLRAIQEKKVRKVGATQEESVDVRIISATHQNLNACVETGKFRQDLYYRLNVIELKMPSLRECADVQNWRRLCSPAWRDAGIETAPSLPRRCVPAGLQHRQRANWKHPERALAPVPGNASTKSLYLTPPEVNLSSPELGGNMALPDYLDQLERQAIMDALTKTRYNKTAAAKLLGITFRALRYRLDRLGMD